MRNRKGIELSPRICPGEFLEQIELVRGDLAQGPVVSRIENHHPSADESATARMTALFTKDKMLHDFRGSSLIDEVPSGAWQGDTAPVFERELSALKRQQLFGRSVLLVNDSRSITVNPYSDYNWDTMLITYRQEGIIARYKRDELRGITLSINPRNPVIVEKREMPRLGKIVDWAGELLVSVHEAAQGHDFENYNS